MTYNDQNTGLLQIPQMQYSLYILWKKLFNKEVNAQILYPTLKWFISSTHFYHPNWLEEAIIQDFQRSIEKSS